MRHPDGSVQAAARQGGSGTGAQVTALGPDTSNRRGGGPGRDAPGGRAAARARGQRPQSEGHRDGLRAVGGSERSESGHVTSARPAEQHAARRSADRRHGVAPRRWREGRVRYGRRRLPTALLLVHPSRRAAPQAVGVARQGGAPGLPVGASCTQCVVTRVGSPRAAGTVCCSATPVPCSHYTRCLLLTCSPTPPNRPPDVRAAGVCEHEQPEGGPVGSLPRSLRPVQRHRARRAVHHRPRGATRPGLSLHRLRPVPVRWPPLLAGPGLPPPGEASLGTAVPLTPARLSAPTPAGSCARWASCGGWPQGRCSCSPAWAGTRH